MMVVLEENNNQIASDCQKGRPRLPYSDAGSRLKRKMATDLANIEENNTSFLVHAASISAKKEKMSDTTFVLKHSISTSSASTEIRKKLIFSEPVPLTPIQALAFLIDNSLTKAQYNGMRALNKTQFSNNYPSYNKVSEAKLACRPAGVHVTETRENITDVKLIASYGFDGTTGQSMYKQRFLEDESHLKDDSVFVTSLIPLKLTDDLETPLWINKSTQSVRFCRPLKIEFTKETKELILAKNSCHFFPSSHIN
ncbi:uncharacterized protein LOC110117565 [Ceratitis capitata]|uniref:uncharacterized protein LOC110117565 n=1 Tax=Ceratitis capitata TaxID=7213 RepID=UPI000A11406E|nr:uncharacterized protein LOC110117565 [Ceratitis capitata]